MERRDAVCNRMEPLIAAHVADELGAEERVVVEGHLGHCPACRRLAAEQQAVRALLRVRGKGLRELPPALLEERIRDRLNRVDARQRRQRWLAVAAVASVVAGLWLGGMALDVGEEPAGQLVVAETVNDHIRSLLSPDTALEITTSDPQVLSRWFRGRLDIVVDVPSLEGSGLTLRGGRVCYLLDRRGAYLMYEGPQIRHSLFIMGRAGVHLPTAEEVTLMGRRVCLTRYKGYNLAVWETEGVVYALVGACPRVELKEIAATTLRG